jgi:hypothetical protein
LLVGLSTVFSLTGRNHVNLAASRTKCSSISSSDTEENKLGHIAEIKSDASTVGSPVLSDLVPNEIRLVGESPTFQDRQTFRKEGVWDPEIEVGHVFAEIRNRQRHYVIEV